MKNILEKLKGVSKSDLAHKITEEEQLRRQVTALFGLLSNIYGSDKLILKAGKLEALNLMRSEILGERVLALQKIVFEDPTIDIIPSYQDIPLIIEDIEDEIADIIARKSVEDKLEKKIAERMQQRHEEYMQEIKMQILKENAGPENAQTLKQLNHLEELDKKKLARTAMDVLRPSSLDEVVGQERAVQALLSKLASPYPQHIILYGPPGVGKTTTARLALEAVKDNAHSPFEENAPFVEVDGTTLRWDPREVTNPLLGSVHDPIYQGARKDLAESGIPEPKLGLVTDAHGGILFIDEIGELDPILQNKLLKVLEDKKVYFDSAYYDPEDANIPKYIKKLFEEGAPADFILIGATTRDPESINPAIRSRCAEVYFEPLNPQDIQEIVRNAAEKLNVALEPGIPAIISEYTIEGRKAINIMADAYGMVLYRYSAAGNSQDRPVITEQDVYQVVQTSRLHPYVTVKGSDTGEIGRIFGLGVLGFVGSVLEIEAVAFPVKKKGTGSIRFNDTAGSMAKDSVFNAASVIRQVTGEDLNNYDVHVNIVGGGQIDGPSAGCAITLTIISALQGKPIRQNVAVTGEISIQGKVKAVGGVLEKIYGAKQAGITTILIPEENAKDVPFDMKNIKVIPVQTIQKAMEYVFAAEE
ncbi:MAG: Lon family ATP-dependent protease [Clostridia bacterium]|nr:Lon family ATP-dependent protease [Clostridia bacterium]